MDELLILRPSTSHCSFVLFSSRAAVVERGGEDGGVAVEPRYRPACAKTEGRRFVQLPELSTKVVQQGRSDFLLGAMESLTVGGCPPDYHGVERSSTKEGIYHCHSATSLTFLMVFLFSASLFRSLTAC